MFKSAIYLISKSTVFKMCFLGVNILRQCFTVTGCWCWGGGGMGGRLPEEVSLMLACEIHNHWSHCWALISPAVSSLKGQKSIRLHYRADSVVISTQASSPVQAHMRPRPHNTKTESDSWLSFRLRGLIFCLLLIMWLRSYRLYCDKSLFPRNNAILFSWKGNNQPSMLQWWQRNALQALSH